MEAIMKVKSLIALLIAAVMICTAFVSCGKKEERKVTVSFIATVDETGEELDEDDIIGDSIEVVLEHTKSSPATVLQAATQALAYLDLQDGYELRDDGMSIKRISKYAEHQEDDEDTGYYTLWEAYVNGDRTTTGKQGVVEVQDGDKIELRFVAGSQAHENQNYVDDTGDGN